MWITQNKKSSNFEDFFKPDLSYREIKKVETMAAVSVLKTF